jgi:hypothetical protein
MAARVVPVLAAGHLRGRRGHRGPGTTRPQRPAERHRNGECHEADRTGSGLHLQADCAASSGHSQARDYTDHVRRVLAAMLLVLAATLPVIDTVSCPDGCTEAHHEFIDAGSCTGSHDAACLLCVGGYGIARAASILIAADSVSPLAVPPSPHIISNTPPSLDRPPRV